MKNSGSSTKHPLLTSLRQHFTLHRVLLFFIDLGCFVLCYAAAFLVPWLMEGTALPSVTRLLLNLIILLFFRSLFRTCVRSYATVWRYASTRDYIKLILADVFGGGIAIIGLSLLDKSAGVTRNTLALAAGLIASIAMRYFYRWYSNAKNAKETGETAKAPTAIIGAGTVGVSVCRELRYNVHSRYRPVCFVDRDTQKIGGKIADLPVYAEDANTIDRLSSTVSEIIVALPRLSSEELLRVYNLYSKTGCHIQFYDMPLKETEGKTAHASLGNVREFKVEDLLFRDSLEDSLSLPVNFYEDKTVLVTGGGGSIGSELCRQIAACHPKKLVIVDIYENNAYDIQQEIHRAYGKDFPLAVEIASVRDRDRLDSIFAKYRPDYVFHAAAHKHVPLMEHSACEAVKNNVLGTYNTADMAEKYGVKRFLLVSTDKAVNPTNVMGASKRMCEMIVQCRTDSKTAFTAVRFGNVLGSNGSVIPLFKAQIKNGGPVTITDKRIIRYFMTIPEAAGLVLTAGAMAEAGDLFVLDMGQPVRILDLAENMVRLSGYTPYVDMDIKEIGLRPGEKLYEELLIKTEDLVKTANKKIFVERDEPLTRAEVEEKINVLKEAVERTKATSDPEAIREAMRKVVPKFHTPEEVNAQAQNAEEMQIVRTPAEAETKND